MNGEMQNLEDQVDKLDKCENGTSASDAVYFVDTNLRDARMPSPWLILSLVLITVLSLDHFLVLKLFLILCIIISVLRSVLFQNLHHLRI